MDKVKAFMATMKKHHFWVLTGLVLILSLTGWYLAASDLEAQYKANRQKIDSEFTELTSIVSKTNHPNEKFEQGTKLLTADLRKDVNKAWTLVYADQKSKVLKWPPQLGEDFLEWMDDPDNYEKEIPVEFRERYLNYVKEEFPRLLEIVDARPFWDKSEDEAGGGAFGGRRRPAAGTMVGGKKRPEVPQRDFKVIWDRKNQQAIDESLDFPRGTPSTVAVRFCQENLWVYHALLNSVAHVNEDATGHHNAKIKEIISVSIGQDASEILQESLASGRVISANGQVGQSGMPMAMPMEGGGMPMQMPTPGGDGMEGGERPGVAPGMLGAGNKPLDDKRYLDDKGMPLLTGTTGAAEFKRMPIVMRLVMDQREIAKLLVRLADSPLPVEITQLRINTKMQGYSDQRPRLFGGGMDGGGGLGARGGPNVMRRDKTLEEATQNPYDLAVELQGIIYIFNPPDRKLTEALIAEGEIAEGQITGEADPSTQPADAGEEEAPAAEAEPGDAAGPGEGEEAAAPAEPGKEGEAAEFEAGAEPDADAPKKDAAEGADAAPDKATDEDAESTETDEAQAEPAADAEAKPPARKPAADDDEAPFGE